MMLRLIAAARRAAWQTFLDLGCGDGVLASAFSMNIPHARGISSISLNAMLTPRSGSLQPHRDRVDFSARDLRPPGWTATVRPGAPSMPSSLRFAIHHLPDARKRELYGEIFDLLSRRAFSSTSSTSPPPRAGPNRCGTTT